MPKFSEFAPDTKDVGVVHYFWCGNANRVWNRDKEVYEYLPGSQRELDGYDSIAWSSSIIDEALKEDRPFTLITFNEKENNKYKELMLEKGFVLKSDAHGLHSHSIFLWVHTRKAKRVKK